MPNRHTFLVKPLQEVVEYYRKESPGLWIDPFAGFHSPAEIRNDINSDAPTDFHLDAPVFMRQLGDGYSGGIFDPPYSLTKLCRCYPNGRKGASNPTGGFVEVKDEMVRVIKKGGIVISFGWNSNGMGKKRGFKIIEIILCCHGGNRNDTIVTVEQKIVSI